MRNRHLFLLDAAALVVSPVIAFVVRFEDFGWLGENLRMVLPYILLAGPIRLAVFYNLGMYRRLWRHASIGELKQILVAGGIAAIFAAHSSHSARVRCSAAPRYFEGSSRIASCCGDIFAR